MIQGDDARGAATLGFEGEVAVECADVQHALAAQVGQAQAVDFVAQEFGRLEARRDHAVAQVDRVPPERDAIAELLERRLVRVGDRVAGAFEPAPCLVGIEHLQGVRCTLSQAVAVTEDEGPLLTLIENGAFRRPISGFPSISRVHVHQ